jgi:hypothetical protein
MRLLVVLAATLMLAAAAAAAPAGDVHRLALRKVVLNDPHVPPRVRAIVRAGHGAGLDRPLYGDLTGDGSDEVAVPIFSGGTAGDVALFVYSLDGGRLRDIYAAPSLYKIAARIRHGALVYVEPVYKASDPNCCPSSFRRLTLGYRDGKLRVVRVEHRPGSSPWG